MRLLSPNCTTELLQSPASHETDAFSSLCAQASRQKIVLIKDFKRLCLSALPAALRRKASSCVNARTCGSGCKMGIILVLFSFWFISSCRISPQFHQSERERRVQVVRLFQTRVNQVEQREESIKPVLERRLLISAFFASVTKKREPRLVRLWM